MKSSPRSVTATAVLSLVTTVSLIGPASPAQAVVEPSASVSAVSCVDEDGTLTVILEAGDSAETFIVLVDGSSIGDDSETPVDAGATGTVVATGLEDGEHTVEVLLENPDAEADTIALEDRTVACDVAPEGPYTNIKGTVYDQCAGYAEVSASNKPIAGAVENLQPATFEVVFSPTDDAAEDPTGGDDSSGDPVDGVEDPPDGGARAAADAPFVLDTFVLDAETQTYDRTFGPDELGGTGDLTLRSGGEIVAEAHIGICLVLPVESGAGGEDTGGNGPAVPDTGF